MEKKILLFSILGMIFLMGIVSAGLESLGIFKQDEHIRLVQICDDASYVTISSVSYPNGSVGMASINMSSIGNGEFYYYFNNTNTLGVYNVRGISDGCENTFTFYFEVTPKGTITSSSQGILSIGILASVLFLMIFFGWLSFKFIESDSMFGIGLFFLVLSLVLSLYSLFLGYIFARDFLFTSISSVQEGVFISGLLGLTGIMFITFTFLIIKVIKELKVKKIGKQYGEGYDQKSKTYNY